MEWIPIKQKDIYDTYYFEKFKKNPWDKGDMIQKFSMIWNGITPLKNKSNRYKLPLKK